MLRYAITDRRRLASDEAMRQSELCRIAEGWSRKRVDFVQLREKDLPPGALAELARSLIRALKAASAAGERPPRLLISARVDVAIAVGADGVHLTSSRGSLTPAHVRQLYAASGLPGPVVSVSCHSLAETERAREGGADLILFGPVFEKVVGAAAATHAAAVLVSCGTGLNLMRNACVAAAPIPVLALGGVTEANAESCLEAGAEGIAAIRLFAR